MRYLAILLSLCLLGTSEISAKVSPIDVQKTLKEAKAIRTIIVTGYNDSMMFYRYPHQNDTFQIGCKSKAFSDQFRAFCTLHKLKTVDSLMGTWPVKGQTVIVVIDSSNVVVLFAKQIGEDYRFWDPNFREQGCQPAFAIIKQRPFKSLGTCMDIPGWGQDNAYWICGDGFLMIAADLKEKGGIDAPVPRFVSH